MSTLMMPKGWFILTGTFPDSHSVYYAQNLNRDTVKSRTLTFVSCSCCFHGYSLFTLVKHVCALSAPS